VSALLQCPGCGWFTRQLQPDGRCLDCNLGWTTCPQRMRLEWAGSEHRRVTAHEVLTTMRAYEKAVMSTPTTGPRGVSGPT